MQNVHLPVYNAVFTNGIEYTRVLVESGLNLNYFKDRLQPAVLLNDLLKNWKL